jgi:hypothetical protein
MILNLPKREPVKLVVSVRRFADNATACGRRVLPHAGIQTLQLVHLVI